MQGDDPPFLPVGTDVSAKYKGAFCEAKIKKVVRNIKCKVTLKSGGGIITVNDDVVKGTLRVGSAVEVKPDPKKDVMEAVITKIQDCSQYTVVFDDGDITTLRRSALCLKSGRHFNESETLDQLPLTHPEHFSTPVIAGRRGRRGRAQSDESEGEITPTSRRLKADSAEREPHVGRVVLVEAASGAERRRPHQPAFPALVVAPTVQIKVKEDYLVRSFKDGRYYTVPKKEAREFRKGSAPLEWAGVEAALQYLNNGVLPPHWDRDSLFNEPRNTSDDSSDDEPREEKDHFVAQLYKFMDDRGTPLNRNPTIANRDIDLYRLFRVVQKLGGYNRVTNQNQWKTIADKMGFHPVTTSITNLCKQAYKKFLHSFEDFYRKLGVTLVAHPRGARTPPAGRSLIRDRDKHPPTSSSASSTPTNTPSLGQRGKDSDKSETDKSDKSEKEDKIEKKARQSDEEDSTDNQPLVVTAPKIEKDKGRNSPATTTVAIEKIDIKPRSESKTRTTPPAKTELHERRTLKRRQLSSKNDGASTDTPRPSRRPLASTDSDSSGRASRCGLTKKMQSRRSQSANSASSGNTIASNSSKRPRKRKTTEPSSSEPTRPMSSNMKAQIGDKLKVYYGPNQSESKVTYEAKVIEISAEGMLRVHYTGWNTRYDEWIKPQRIALNVTQHEARSKKGTNSSRRMRPKRTEESSTRSDSSDSDTDEDVKRPSKKSEEKSNPKTPSISKDAKSSDSSSSSKPRKRPIRIISALNVSPQKKQRLNVPSHQGRDYDLNEIRSELKGLQTVKQEPEDPSKQEVKEMEKDLTSAPPQIIVPSQEPPQPEKQPEDVYEFKEPEPFELELHDEKKKRTHRIFDDISPTKYTPLPKSLSEEIAEDPLRSRPPSLRSPNLSPFRDFGLTRDIPGRQSPEEDSKDGLFFPDDDSFPGEGSSGPIFEGFTPAKNQETYSKKSKVTKLRELIDDSPDSPADDEQSSEEETEHIIIKENIRETEVNNSNKEELQNPAPNIEEEQNQPHELKTEQPTTEIEKDKEIITEEPKLVELIISEPPKTPPEDKTLEFTATLPVFSTTCPTVIEIKADMKEELEKEERVTPILVSTPMSELKETTTNIINDENKLDTMDTNPMTPKVEMPSSPLIDTEEDKSEPDSPARMDVLPEPPPRFLLQSEGPKIAEKLLQAINSAKRLSMSPPPAEDRPDTPLNDILKLTKPEPKLSPVPLEFKSESLKPITKLEPPRKLGLSDIADSIFGEPSNFTDLKREGSDIKKVKSKDPSPPRLQSPLSILERRKSVADLPLSIPGKNNKVLSDTIQKLTSQINQPAVNITLPAFTAGSRSDSSDSDDSDRRLIIDKLAMEEWGSSSEASRGVGGISGLSGMRALHAGKSPGEWSAGETLLMLEDACKNERKHSASVVVAGGGRGTEEDSNISLLLCEETIPGSPAPDAEPAPPRHRHHMPFASAPPHHHAHANDNRRGESGSRDVAEPEVDEGEREGAGRDEGGWGRRHALLDNTPPTTPDSSLDMSPHRERRISDHDSPLDRKDDDDESRQNDSAMMDIDNPRGLRSRKASESSAGPARGRRRRRDTDEAGTSQPPHKYNFYVELDPSWDSATRINVLTSRLADLRKTYHSIKAELAAIDRRRKKLRRKEREAVKAAKAACS